MQCRHTPTPCAVWVTASGSRVFLMVMIDREPGSGNTTVTTLTPLELATNRVYGPDPAAPPLPVAPADLTTLAALEAAKGGSFLDRLSRRHGLRR